MVEAEARRLQPGYVQFCFIDALATVIQVIRIRSFRQAGAGRVGTDYGAERLGGGT